MEKEGSVRKRGGEKKKIWHKQQEKVLKEWSEKLKNASKKAILALLIAFFARIDLVIAPFWLIWMMAYYLEDWV